MRSTNNPSMADTTKAKLARKRQRETLKFIQKQQAEEAAAQMVGEIQPKPGTSSSQD